MTAAYRRVHESTGLSMSAVGGWPHVISFMGQTERTNVTSVVCLAFLDAANAHPRSATFGLEVLGGVGAFSFGKMRTAHTRFPALHDVVFEVNDYGSVVPGLQLLLPQLAGFTSITELDLCRQGLVTFPASLCALTGLKKLDLDGNEIAALPDAIGDLKELTYLNVGRNQLTALPDTLGALTGLTEFRAYNNKLTTLPDSIAALTQMKTLHLSFNKFTTLPKPIVRLTSLTTLNLGCNQLVTLPDSIAALTALEKLHLGDNQLVTLPDSIAALTALEELYFDDNPLAKPQSSAVEAWLSALDAGSSSSCDASDEYEEEEDDDSGESNAEEEEDDDSGESDAEEEEDDEEEDDEEEDLSSGGAVAQSERSSDRPPVGTSPSALNIVVCLERKGLGDDLIVEGGSELRPGRSIVIVGARGVKGTGHYLRVVSGDVSERHCRVRLKSVSLQFAFLLTPLNHLSISPSLHISLSLSLSLSLCSLTHRFSLFAVDACRYDSQRMA